MNSHPALAGKWPVAVLAAALRLWAFIRYVAWRFVADRCLTAAGALSYTTLVSLVPLTAIALAVLSAFPIFTDIRDQLLGSLFRNFVPEVGAEVEWWFRYFAGTSVRTTTIGILALAVTVILLLATIEDQLHNIWHVASPRPWVQRILAYWAILTLGPLLLGVSFSLPGYLSIAARHTGFDATAIFDRPAGHDLLQFLPFVLETFVFTLLFALIPNCSVRWREAFVGAVVSAALIEGLKVGFTLYIAYLSTYRAVYGALAAIPIFLLWMYVAWSVVLFGAVVAAAMPQWRVDEHAAATSPAAQRLGLALALLAELADLSRSGGTLATSVLANRLDLATTAVDDHLTMLRQAGFVAATADGGWVLARALDGATLIELYRALQLPLAGSLVDVDDVPWQARISVAIHHIATAESAALSLRLSDLLDTGASPAVPLGRSTLSRRG